MKKTIMLVLLLAGFQANAVPLISGIQVNTSFIDQATLGWTECLNIGGSEIVDVSTALAGCGSGDQLAMAAYQVGSTDYSIFGSASFADVTMQTGAASHVANGIQWYRTDGTYPRSWGFTEVGVSTQRSNCDLGLLYDSNKGMCWHENGGNISTGWALNNGTFSYINSDWRRVLLVSNSMPSADAPEPSIIALFAAGLFGLGFARRRKVQS
jgi:hypothetical protein